MTEIVKWEIMTHLCEVTSLHKLLFLEHCHLLRDLFIYTAPRSMLNIWGQKQAGCRRKTFFSLTESRFCRWTVNFSFVCVFLTGFFLHFLKHGTLCLISLRWRLACTAWYCLKGTKHDTSCLFKHINNFFQSALFERYSTPQHSL